MVPSIFLFSISQYFLHMFRSSVMGTCLFRIIMFSKCIIPSYHFYTLTFILDNFFVLLYVIKLCYDYIWRYIIFHPLVLNLFVFLCLKYSFCRQNTLEGFFFKLILTISAFYWRVGSLTSNVIVDMVAHRCSMSPLKVLSHLFFAAFPSPPSAPAVTWLKWVF